MQYVRLKLTTNQHIPFYTKIERNNTAPTPLNPHNVVTISPTPFKVILSDIL